MRPEIRKAEGSPGPASEAAVATLVSLAGQTIRPPRQHLGAGRGGHHFRHAGQRRHGLPVRDGGRLRPVPVAERRVLRRHPGRGRPVHDQQRPPRNTFLHGQRGQQPAREPAADRGPLRRRHAGDDRVRAGLRERAGPLPDLVCLADLHRPGLEQLGQRGRRRRLPGSEPERRHPDRGRYRRRATRHRPAPGGADPGHRLPERRTRAGRLPELDEGLQPDPAGVRLRRLHRTGPAAARS